MVREITFNNSIINDSSSCYVIAEIGNNHQGDVDNAKKLIKAAKSSGASAVKFQRRDNKELFTSEMFDSPYAGPQSFAPTYGEHRDKLELSDNDFEEIYKEIKKNSIDIVVIGKDNKNILRLIGTFFPITNKTARENAISVAVGIAHPERFSGLL